MRKWIIGAVLAVAGIAAIIVIALQGQAEGDDGDEFELHSEARVIEDDSEILSYDLDTGELRTAGPVEVGEVLVAGVTPATPYGMMVRVDSVSDDGTAQTTQAELTEVIASTGGPIAVEGQAVDVEVIPEPGVTYTPNLSGGAGGTYSPLLEAELAHTFTFDKSHTSNGATYKVAGELSTGAKASLLIDIGLFRGLKELEAKFTPTTSASVAVEVSRKGTAEREDTLGKIDRTWVYMVGVVPVVMTTGMDVSLKTSVTVEATAKVSTSASAQVALGYRYRDGDGGAFVEPEADAEAPALDGDGTKLAAAVRAEVLGSLKAEFYKTVAFTGGAGPYAEAEIAATANQPVMQCTWGAGLAGEVSTRAGVKVLGIGGESTWTASVSRPWITDRRCPNFRPADPLRISPTSISSQLRSMDWEVGSAIDEVRVSATGGSPGGDGYAFEIVGDLPPGIELTSAGDAGTLRGTPTEEGTYNFTLTVTDGQVTRRAMVRVEVDPAPLPPPEPLIHWAGDGLMGPVGSGSHMPFAFGGGRAPYTITVAEGVLPPGLELERSPEEDLFEIATAQAVVSGVATEAGEWPVVIRAEDAAGQVVDVEFTFVIPAEPPAGEDVGPEWLQAPPGTIERLENEGHLP